MSPYKTLLCLSITAALLAGCKKPDAAPAEAPAASEAATAPAESASGPAPAAPTEVAPAPAVTAFDINKIPVSDKPLGEWPYVALPAGYRWSRDDIARQSKDLARVPIWTGGELLWVEGRTFSDAIRNADGKTYSRFEVRKGIEQAIAAMGGQRIGERSFDEAVYNANKKAINDFTSEFGDMSNAYWYGNDADTYLVRRADKAIWFVTTANNDRTVLMVAEGPLPQPATP